MLCRGIRILVHLVGPQKHTMGDWVMEFLFLSPTQVHSSSRLTPFLSSNVVVPSVTPNLLLVSQFAIENNCAFLFYGRYFLAISLRNGQILLQGKLENGVYRVLPFLSMVSPSTFTTSPASSINLRHHRLGHVPLML